MRSSDVWSLGAGEETSGDDTAGVDGLGGPGGIDCGREGGREGGVSTRGKDATQFVSELLCENLTSSRTQFKSEIFQAEREKTLTRHQDQSCPLSLVGPPKARARTPGEMDLLEEKQFQYQRHHLLSSAASS